MSAAPKNKSLEFIKMNGIGNDFVIFDARKKPIKLGKKQIIEICDRKNIGCDQLIIITKGGKDFDAKMEIYNSDSSKSGACGNATRCVAALLFENSSKKEIKIKSAAGILSCTKNGKLISVNMGKVKFTKNISLFGFDFKCADIGNPHAVTFIKNKIPDADFYKIAPQVVKHKFFPKQTNVEFARILSDNLIEVRVFERGAGETLACGSGACCVAALAIKNSLVKSKKITIRFAGGDLIIEQKTDSSIVMSGDYKKIFTGKLFW